MVTLFGPDTIPVRITIDLDLENPGDLDAELVNVALERLAAIMAVQAEDDLWLGGSPDAENPVELADGTFHPNVLLACLTVSDVSQEAL